MEVTPISLKDLLDVVKKARDQHKKYCIFFDKSDNVATFFLYKGLLKEINKEMMKLESGRVSKAQICEVIREGLVQSMKYGQLLAISMDEYRPDFLTEFSKPEGLEKFDTDLIFDREKFLKDENFKSILNEDEDQDL